VSTSPNGVKRGGILGPLLAPLRHAGCIERCPEVVRFRHFSDVRCLPRVAIFFINGGAAGPVATGLRRKLVDIQYGRAADPHNWIRKVL
jgi:hypothetical protein